MRLESIILSERSQIEKDNTTGSLLHVESKEQTKTSSENKWWLPEAGGRSLEKWVRGVKDKKKKINTVHYTAKKKRES